MAITKHKVAQKTPHAAVLIWNYQYRAGSELTPSPQHANSVEPVIVSTLSLVGIQTQKQKGTPAGNFTIQLAPTKNWVGTITPGSWMCIMMSQTKINKDDFSKFNADKVKFFGRIHSVRVSVTADETGARRTIYTVSGTDWGDVFNSIIYIDPLAQTQGAIQSATALALQDLIVERDDPSKAFSTRRMLKGLINLWGKPLKIKEFEDATNLIGSASSKFALPDLTARFFGIGKSVVDSIELISGTLKKEDTLNTSHLQSYKKFEDANGYIDVPGLIGQHSVWQILQSHANPTINEMYCDLRVEKVGGLGKTILGSASGQSKVYLALYNRVKPFYIKHSGSVSGAGDRFSKGNPGKANPADAKPYISKFDNIRKIEIPTEEIISFEAGNNWRDKFNFVEVRSGMNDNTLIKDSADAEIKLNSQLADVQAFQREGFKPFIAMTKQIPLSSKGGGAKTMKEGLKRLAAWKFILREWYFDTHRLLNGTINIMGQNDYIQIGDNIMIDADILSATDNYNAAHSKLKDKAKLLLHVESISHNFTVGRNGERSWITTIQFVRGIVVDEKGKIARPSPKSDSYASALSSSQDKNSTNVLATSTEADPDTKVKGK